MIKLLLITWWPHANHFALMLEVKIIMTFSDCGKIWIIPRIYWNLICIMNSLQILSPNMGTDSHSVPPSSSISHCIPLVRPRPRRDCSARLDPQQSVPHQAIVLGKIWNIIIGDIEYVIFYEMTFLEFMTWIGRIIEPMSNCLRIV